MYHCFISTDKDDFVITNARYNNRAKFSIDFSRKYSSVLVVHGVIGQPQIISSVSYNFTTIRIAMIHVDALSNFIRNDLSH